MSALKWEALRLKTMANLCPPVRARVAFNIARYRETDDGAYGRAWITVDGERIAESFPVGELLNLLGDYIDIPPPEALSSECPLWRALAVADRRLPEATLDAFPVRKDPDGLVRLFFALRKGLADDPV